MLHNKKNELQIKIDNLVAERNAYISGEQIKVDNINVRMEKVDAITNELELLWDEMETIYDLICFTNA